MAVLESHRWNLFSASLLLLLFTTQIETTSLTEVADNSVSKQVTVEDKDEMVCPSVSVTLPIFSLPCKTDKDCDILGELCCNVDGKMRCRKGVPRPTPNLIHTLLGFIPRDCPANPITEILPVKNCTNDSDCWPRICCPDGPYSYCRTSMPQWTEPTGFSPLRSTIPYLQCTPPPPPLFDLFPKPCRTPVDCFPNLCCQEQGKKFCRPPRKSLLALIATVTQRLG